MVIVKIIGTTLLRDNWVLNELVLGFNWSKTINTLSFTNENPQYKFCNSENPSISFFSRCLYPT